MRQYFEQLPRLLEIEKRRLGLDPAASLPADAPTRLVAIEGIGRLIDGDLDGARQASTQLASRLVWLDDETALIAAMETSDDMWPYDIEASAPSASAQALALSLFEELTDIEADAGANAAATANGFRLSIDEGGFARYEDSGVLFERYSVATPTRSLGGGLLATLALADYVLGNPEVSAELSGLVDMALSYWSDHLSDYSMLLADEDEFSLAPLIASRRAFAPESQKSLWHIVGPDEVSIDRISIGVDASGSRVSLDVGADGDSAIGAVAHVWFDEQYQNWSPPLSENGRTIRKVTPGRGEYDHAPFTLTVPLDDSVAGSLSVEYLGGGPDTLVQLFDGSSYITVGTLDRSTVWTTVSIDVEVAVSSTATSTDPSPAADPRFFAQHYALGMLLAQASADDGIRSTVESWRQVLDYVPGEVDPRRLPGPLQPNADPVFPTIAGFQESVHVEYPVVAQQSDGSWLMLYSATGPESGWAIQWATSNELSGPWDRHGTVLAFEGFEQAAFPGMVVDEDGIIVTASVDTDGDARYDRVLSARGSSIDTLGSPIVVVAEGALDGSLWRDKSGYHLSYALVGADGLVLRQVDSIDAETWSTPTDLLRAPRFGGFYTHDSLDINGTRLWVINSARSIPAADPRRSWLLYCSNVVSGALHQVPDIELNVTDGSTSGWEVHRYGMEIIEVVDGHLVALHNGIRLDEGDGNGQIALSRFDWPDDLDLQMPAECQASELTRTSESGSSS